MTATWSVIQPLAATNYGLNMSFELGAGVPTSWAQVGAPSALGQFSATAYVWRGAYSSRCVVASGYAGISQDIALTNGNNYTCSIYINVFSGPVMLVASDFGNNSNQVIATSSGTGWQRLVVNKAGAVGTGGTGVRMVIQSNNAAATWYMDCAQCEDGLVATTWFDGYETGCWWNGTPNANSSGRDGQSREGGTLVDISSYLKVTSLTGHGMMPVNVASLPMGLAGGEIYQRTTSLARRMIFTGNILGSGNDNLHSKRNSLINLVRKDLVTPEQPFWMVYNDGGTTVERYPRIKCVYEGGLDGNFDNTTMYNHAERGAQLRVVCHDPLFYSEKQECIALGYSQTVTANYGLMRGAGGDPTQKGIWQIMGTGFNNVVNDVVYNPVDNSIYFCGDFTTANGVTVNGAAKWTIGGTTFTALGSGFGGATKHCYCMCVAANGYVYFGGNFVTANGVTCNGLGYWNGTTFVAIGSGVAVGSSEVIYALCFDSSNNIWAGGGFAHINGVAAANIAYYTASTWTACGTGTSDIVYSIVLGKDLYIYIGGAFATANGVTVHAVARWTGSTFAALSTGVIGGGATVLTMDCGLDGSLFIAGEINTAGGVTVSNIARWTGTAFVALGTGTSDYVHKIKVNQRTGQLWVSGAFTTAGGVNVNQYAIWTGTTWIPMDIILPANSIINAFAIDQFQNTYIGFYHNGSATSAAVIAPSNSSTKAYPVIWLYGPGTIYQIINYTTGKSIYFNNLQLQTGEVVMFDLKPGQQSLYSYWRGNLSNAILLGSDLDFYLQPGSNNISCYVTGASINPIMAWRNTFNSSDGAA